MAFAPSAKPSFLSPVRSQPRPKQRPRSPTPRGLMRRRQPLRSRPRNRQQPRQARPRRPKSRSPPRRRKSPPHHPGPIRPSPIRFKSVHPQPLRLKRPRNQRPNLPQRKPPLLLAARRHRFGTSALPRAGSLGPPTTPSSGNGPPMAGWEPTPTCGERAGLIGGWRAKRRTIFPIWPPLRRIRLACQAIPPEPRRPPPPRKTTQIGILKQQKRLPARPMSPSPRRVISVANSVRRAARCWRR